MNVLPRAITAGLFTILALWAAAVVLRLRFRLMHTRAPVDTHLLRPPGESLRLRLEQLNEKQLFFLALLSFVPIFFASASPNFPDLTSAIIVVVLVAVFVTVVLRARLTYRDYLLGLAGERAVAEELNQLMLEGCRVFHDYPGGPNWNIDHVIVAPSGVYAIETKTRRKARASKGRKEQEVFFDGAKFQFPNYTTTCGLDQARRNAADLGRELSSATGEPVQVKAILTFPGWYIIRRSKCDVCVVNPKEIRQIVLAKDAPQLSPQQIQRIAHQVEQKCRDVAF
jgi:hypothetical protein